MPSSGVPFVSIGLSQRQFADLKQISKIGRASLRAFLDSLSSIESRFVTVNTLFEIANSTIERDAAKALIRSLVSFRILCRQRNVDEDGVIGAIDRNINDARTWTDAEKEEWRSIAPTFRELLSSGLVSLVAKASDLAFDYANLMDSARLITDIRPIYDDHHTDILGGVISNVLRVVYISDYGPHSLSIAMDENDVRRLHASCDEALKKMAVAQSCLQSHDLAVITPGEERDVFGNS